MQRRGLPPHCAFHGLPKAGSAATGQRPAARRHATLKEIERYTKDASRKLLAESAMDKVTRSSVKPAAKFDNKRRKS